MTSCASSTSTCASRTSCSTPPSRQPVSSWPSPTPSTARCPTGSDPAAAEYEGAWQAFVTTLDAHAEEEERDLLPPPVAMTEQDLEALGNQMLTRMDELRASRAKQLRVKVRAAVLRAL